MMRMFVVIVFLLTSACAAMHEPRADRAGAMLPLVAPSVLGADRSANQVVRGAFGARDMTMNCVLSVHDGQLTVIGLTALGIRAFTLHYDGRDVSVEHSLPVPPQLTPERLLVDIELVFFPLPALQHVLQPAGWQLTETAGTRRLRRDGTLVAEIHYASADPWQGRSWLVNFKYGYTLGIDSTVLSAH